MPRFWPAGGYLGGGVQWERRRLRAEEEGGRRYHHMSPPLRDVAPRDDRVETDDVIRAPPGCRILR
jgi:hypothetical protein